MAYWEKVKGWYGHPFDSDMGVNGWFAFIGLLLVIMIVWRLIMSHIVAAAD